KGARQPGSNRFRFKPGDLRRLENLPDVDVVALHLWVSVRLGIDRIDEKENLISFVRPSRRRLVDGPKPARYYIQNALELLDAPGEWYLHRQSPTFYRLYYAPAVGEKVPDVEAIAPRSRLTHLVRFDGQPEAGRYVEHVTLRGLTFAHAEWWPDRR